MFRSPPSTSKALPKDYRVIADGLFPPGGFPEGEGPAEKVVESFAKILGIGNEYSRLSEAYRAGRPTEDYLNRFQNNLDLLIQKTWVEKADEERKERLLVDVPPFITLIERGDYSEALEEFGAILEELAYLFFGAQSQKDDFADYVLRIDPQIGLFWWYGGQINNIRGVSWVKSADRHVLRALLFLGICYLTNF